ncbi:MAG: 50S ribosomal protein L16 [Deltaproteobacteria bacterium]
MLSPSKTKYRKQMKGRIRGCTERAASLSFGDYGLKAVSGGRVTAQQIEAARIVINRYIRRRGKMWIRIFPDKPVTKKPAETRMGSGKGAVELWVAPVRPGRIIYEMEGVDEVTAREALRLASYKLPITTRFVMRDELP